MTKLTITWEIEEDDSDARADKETDILFKYEGKREHIDSIISQIKEYSDFAKRVYD